MITSLLLSGITQQTIKSERLTTAYLTAGSGEIPLVLVHGNCSSSLFFQDLMLMLAETGRYTLYAPDMRGYGDSDVLPVDGTRGVRDYSDDLAAFVQALQLPSFHLLGWSLGGNVVWQYAIDYPTTLRSLLLEAPGSPYGFGGTKDAEGTPTWPDDFSGSGGGVVNPGFVQSLANGDRSNGDISARAVMNNTYFKPPFRVAADREEIYVSAILSTRVTAGNYPGDFVQSSHWPHTAPGTQGVNNALSPKYLNQRAFLHLDAKPPTAWIHGQDDQIVSDSSLSEIGFLGQIGVFPGWPGAEVYPPQPMKTQIRSFLEQYRANGGEYRELSLPECGHSPHIEKQDEFVRFLLTFIEEH